MRIVEFNNTNLTEQEIVRTVNKVRGILINEKGQALITKYAGIYMLPGVSIEDGESPQTALKKEIFEETGIKNIEIEKDSNFLQIISYDRNYYDRKFKRPINRKTITNFYIANTKETIDVLEQNLTESEKNNGFEAKFENLSIIPYTIEINTTKNNPKRDNFDREILTVLREFAQYRQKNNEEIER